MHGEREASAVGKKIIFPSSFTGGPRYISNNYLDAMAICGRVGYPDLFITFTCKPKWPEILRYVDAHDSEVENQPHIVSRILQMKLDLLMKHIKSGTLFGPVKAATFHC